MIKINGIYRHYKGNLYKVLCIGKHTEAMEDLVIYQAMYGEQLIWCRPVNMWTEEIEFNGNKIKRFGLIEDYNG